MRIWNPSWAIPGCMATQRNCVRVNRELKELLPVVETYRAYQAADSRRREAEELLHDPEMKEMAQDELAEAKEELEQLKEKLTILLLPRDPNDSRNVILEIRGGVGGEESALFAHSLLRMYTMYAESRGWKLEIASYQRNGAWRREGLLCRH